MAARRTAADSARLRASRGLPREAGVLLVNTLTQRELAILTVALRYWRAQRAAGHVRRTDPSVTPEAVDLLVSKLGAASWASLSV